MQFFTSPEDLSGWVKSQPTPDEAATKLLNIFEEDNSEEDDIVETCRVIFNEDEDGNASKVLFGVLAKHNLTQIKEAKGVKNMNKTAQDAAVQSRQRDNWVRGNRNKWNRVVDGYNEGTPWRIDRDKFYNFTHYYTDAISFDADPNRVYSGEAIWRMYIMDKFTSDYQDKNGRVVGGYINDRFYRFPTAGTPANPDVDRLQGNQMELAAGERTRKPRPHQYSVERRLEEARGNKTESLTAVVAQANAVIKLASTSVSQKEKDDDRVFNIFKDTLEMREAGIDYSTMLEAVSEHYDVGIMGVAEIDKIAQNLKKKHEGIMYVKEASGRVVLAEYNGPAFQVGNAMVNAIKEDGQSITLPTNTVFSQVGPNIYQVESDETGMLLPQTKFAIENLQTYVSDSSVMPIDDGMNELSGEIESTGSPAPESTLETIQDFPVEEVMQ